MSIRLKLREPIALGLGAIGGALSRYYLGQSALMIIETKFPLETFAINLSGCFLMGIVATATTKFSVLSPELRLLLTTGFLGAYTTFSTYGLDLSQLMNHSENIENLFYGLGSPVIGFLGLQAGILTTQLLFFSLRKRKS